MLVWICLLVCSALLVLRLRDIKGEERIPSSRMIGTAWRQPKEAKEHFDNVKSYNNTPCVEKGDGGVSHIISCRLKTIIWDDWNDISQFCGAVFPVILLALQGHEQRERSGPVVASRTPEWAAMQNWCCCHSCLLGAWLVAPEPSVFLTLGIYSINLHFWQVDTRTQLSVGVPTEHSPSLTIYCVCLALVKQIF